MKKNLELCLQLFADAAGGDTAQFTGVTEAAAAPQATGEKQASDAGVQTDRASAFEALIKGEYKQEYDARVRDTVQKRLRDHKALSQKLEALSPALEKLAQASGIDPANTPALVQALERAGQAAPTQTRVLVQQQADRWTAQAEMARQTYAGFDLRRELADPRFAKLLQADVDVKTAYEVLHGKEHFSQALAYTAYQMEKTLAGKLAAQQNRPAETGMGSSSAAVVRQDVSQMTPQDRAEIIRRVRKGETIRF